LLRFGHRLSSNVQQTEIRIRVLDLTLEPRQKSLQRPIGTEADQHRGATSSKDKISGRSCQSVVLQPGNEMAEYASLRQLVERPTGRPRPIAR
jgi:hypothetical protein